MKREERWKALAEATDVVKAAEAQLDREATRQTRDAWYEADREYRLRLALVIGIQPVQRYAKRVRAYLEAIDRTARFGATMSTRTADDADVTFMEGTRWRTVSRPKKRGRGRPPWSSRPWNGRRLATTSRTRKAARDGQRRQQGLSGRRTAR